METESRATAGEGCAFSVVVNNYNYAEYLGEALDSVLNQTCRDLQLIVVDDGSTDGSRAIIDGYDDPRLTAIKKENGGQLSCFNAALPHVRGDVVCFLDADDVYEPHYLETLKRVYEETDSDFVFCNMRYFGAQDGEYFRERRPVRIEDSYYLVRFSRKYVGGPTSGLSMRRELLFKILPLEELEPDWITAGDTPLVWGSSLFHGKKYYLPECLVRYRRHDANDSSVRKRLGGKEKADLNRQLMQAWERYAGRFPDSLLVWDFPKVLAEFFRSPIPLLYKDVLRKRLWLAGRLLAKVVARMGDYPALFD